MISVKKNLIYNLAYQLLIIIIPFITTPYIARVIGSDGIGIYNYTYSIAYLCYLFGKLGLENYGNRSIALVSNDKDKLSKTFLSIFYMQLLTSLIVIIFYSIFIVIYPKYKIIFYLQFFYVLSSMFDINWFFFGTQEFKLNVIRNAFIKLISLVLILTFVKNKNDLWVYTCILSVGSLLSQLAMWPFLLNRIKIVRVGIKDILGHFKENFILFIPVVAVSVYTYMDKIILGNLSSMDQTGYYSNAERVIQLPLSLVGAFGAVMLPKMTSLLINRNSEKESSRYMYKSMKLIILLASSTGFGLAAIAPEFTIFFLGNGFRQCIPMIIGLSSTIIFISWASVIRTQFLIPRKFDSIYIWSVLFGAIVNLISNIILVPMMDAMGSVLGTILAEIAVALYQTVKVRKMLPIREYLKCTWMYILFGFVMFILVRVAALSFKQLMLSNIVLVIIEILVGILSFTLLTYLYTVRFDTDMYDSTFGAVFNKFK